MGPRFFVVRLAAISYPLIAIRCLDAHGSNAPLSFRADYSTVMKSKVP